MNIDAFELCFWYSEVQQLLVSIMMFFPSPEHILLRNAGKETFQAVKDITIDNLKHLVKNLIRSQKFH